MNEGLGNPDFPQIDADDHPDLRDGWFAATRRELDRGLRRMARNRPGFDPTGPGFHDDIQSEALARWAARRAEAKAERKPRSKFLDGSDA